MPIPADVVASAGRVPDRVDVVVIGGGVIGVATALTLVQRGISVALCEKGEIAQEQSGRNWGWIRVMGREASEIPLAVESQRMWEQMGRVVGADVGFSRAGIVYLDDSAGQFRDHERWLDHAKPFQLGTRLLSSKEIAGVLPGSARRYAGALFTPNDARAEPFKAVPAMARKVTDLGGHVLTHCAVRGIETTAGRVSGVITEKGSIRCPQVVLAGGAWTRLFLGNMGIDFPALKILGSVLRTDPMEGPPEHTVGGNGFAFRKRQDGGYTIANRGASTAYVTPDSFRLFFDFLPALYHQRAEIRLRVGRMFLDEARLARRWQMDEVTPFEKVRILDPVPDSAALARGMDNLIAAFPAFANARIAQSWAGLIDATPDAVPVIGEVPRLPGFFIASGFSGHGFGIGPGAGRLVADLVAGVTTPLVDPTPYRLDRFERLRRTTVRPA